MNATPLPQDLVRQKLSIVVPIHNEQETLRPLHESISAVLPRLGFQQVEVLLVDDGSTDASEQIIRNIVDLDKRFQGIRLARNFGHQAAVSVGLEHCCGDVIAVIDGDLQDPPHEIVRLLDALENGADVAYGVRTKRKERWYKRMAYAAFYRTLKKIANIDIPLDSGDFCCMRRSVVDAMLQLPERNRFLRGIRAWVGFQQVGVPYERSARFAGTPSYTFRKLVKLAADGLLSFSNTPVRAIQILGMVVLLSAMATTGTLVSLRILDFGDVSAYSILAASIWLACGVQLCTVGVLAEYVTRIWEEVRHRPHAIVLQKHCHQAADDSEVDLLESTMQLAQECRALVEPSAESMECDSVAN